MSNQLITIQGVRGFIDENGTAQLNLEDVSRGLGFTTVATSGNECVRWSRVEEYLQGFGFLRVVEIAKDNSFIPENIFYRLAMKANNKMAETFQNKIANEILPTIRKTGSYVTQPKSALEALQDTVKVLSEHETRINQLDEKVDNQITVTFNQAKNISKAVASRVIELLGGKETPAYKNHRGSYFQQLHSDIHDRLGVPSYRDIRKLDYDIAINYIKAWIPKAMDISA